MQTLSTVVPMSGRETRSSPSPNRKEGRTERSPQITKQKGHRTSPPRSAQEQSLATALQSQMSQLSKQYNDLVKRYNTLESSYQAVLPHIFQQILNKIHVVGGAKHPLARRVKNVERAR